jgi:hypothetical protein
MRLAEFAEKVRIDLKQSIAAVQVFKAESEWQSKSRAILLFGGSFHSKFRMRLGRMDWRPQNGDTCARLAKLFPFIFADCGGLATSVRPLGKKER